MSNHSTEAIVSDLHDDTDDYGIVCPFATEAADRLESLQAENERLRKAFTVTSEIVEEARRGARRSGHLNPSDYTLESALKAAFAAALASAEQQKGKA